MAAEYRVIWSEEAIIDLQEIYDFVLRKWSLKEAERLLDLVKEFEDVIRVYPEGFKPSNSVEGVRIGHIHHNTTAVYRIQDKTIEIVTLFDNRQKEGFRD
jgi:plasmid stabilization system protein ParE